MNFFKKTFSPPVEPPAAPRRGAPCGCLRNLGSRPDQQDSYAVSDLTDSRLCAERGVLLTLADGMGGLENGAEVSRLLVDAMQEAFVNRPLDAAPAPWLLELLGEANRKVNALLEGKEPSGSTLVAALIKDHQLYHLSVGDSRLCLVRGGGLITLNREQSYGQKLDLMLLKEILPPHIIAAHPQRRALTSYVGMGDLEGVDRCTTPITLLSGDMVLLMSDGVFGTLSEQEICSALTDDAEISAIRLERMVLERRKPRQDNFTAVIYRVD